MKSLDLIFIGIKGSVVALNRGTGEQVWATHLKGADFVNVLQESYLHGTTWGRRQALAIAVSDNWTERRFPGHEGVTGRRIGLNSGGPPRGASTRANCFPRRNVRCIPERMKRK